MKSFWQCNTCASLVKCYSPNPQLETDCTCQMGAKFERINEEEYEKQIKLNESLGVAWRGHNVDETI